MKSATIGTSPEAAPEGIPTPSLDDPNLAAGCAAGDAGAGASEGPAVEGEVVDEIPACITVDILEKTLKALEAQFPEMRVEVEQRKVLAEAWQKPIDGLYQKAVSWLNADPATVGPWAQAITVTAMFYGPRLIPVIINRFKKPKATNGTAAPTGQP
jgi:hypothetical protein